MQSVQRDCTDCSIIGRESRTLRTATQQIVQYDVSSKTSYLGFQPVDKKKKSCRLKDRNSTELSQKAKLFWAEYVATGDRINAYKKINPEANDAYANTASLRWLKSKEFAPLIAALDKTSDLVIQTQSSEVLVTKEELQQIARKYTLPAMKALVQVIEDEDAPPSARIQAATVILERGWGKPKQEISVGINETFDRMSDAELRGVLSASLAQLGYAPAGPVIDGTADEIDDDD